MHYFFFQASDALAKVHGTRYCVGGKDCLGYEPSGTSLDWAVGEAKIPYGYGMELSPCKKWGSSTSTTPCKSSTGFVLPSDQIIRVGKEVMAFHVALAQQIMREFGSGKISR